jgi:hypothetical protein
LGAVRVPPALAQLTEHRWGFALVNCLAARWTLSSAAAGQDVPGQEGDDDDRRRDSDDGDGGRGYDHTAILVSCLQTGACGMCLPEGVDTEWTRGDELFDALLQQRRRRGRARAARHRQTLAALELGRPRTPTPTAVTVPGRVPSGSVFLSVE